tara:strand:- start:1884 stop:3236 length:1353 start_codon:yes stop_codon:yes gene_type:complete
MKKNKISFQEKIDRIYKRNRLITADSGKTGVVLFDGENTFFEKKDTFADFVAKNYSGWTFVGESAHFAVPRNHSKAQLLKSGELLKWYAECEENDVGLMFSPHQSSMNVLRYLEKLEENGEIKEDQQDWHNIKQKKEDARDARALHRYIMDHRNFCDGFKSPPESFEITDYTKHVRETKNRMNNALDDMKTHNYGCYDEVILNDERLFNLAYKSSSAAKKVMEQTKESKDFFTDEVSRFFMSNIDEIASKLDPDTLEAFGFIFQTEKSKDENGKTLETKTDKVIEFKAAQFFAVAMPFMGERSKVNDIDGETHFVSSDIKKRNYGDGKQGLWRWSGVKKDLFAFSPNHYKAGVPASNLKHHGRRNYVVDEAKKLGIHFKKPKAGGDPNKLTCYKNRIEICSEGHSELWQKLNTKYVKCTQKLFNVIREFLIENHPDLKDYNRGFSGSQRA